MRILSSQINTPVDVEGEEDIKDDVTLTELYDDLDSVSIPHCKKDSNKLY